VGKSNVFFSGRKDEAKRDVKSAYLDLPGRHLEFFGELFAPRRIGLLVCDKDAL
jgi:hypothetical protein